MQRRKGPQGQISSGFAADYGICQLTQHNKLPVQQQRQDLHGILCSPPQIAICTTSHLSTNADYIPDKRPTHPNAPDNVPRPLVSWARASVHRLPETTLPLPHRLGILRPTLGMGCDLRNMINETTRNTAGFGPWLHLPGFHFWVPIFDPQPYE